MAKQAPAEIYKDIVCAVIASTDRRRFGQGDVQADERGARHIREAARTIYTEIAEEMKVLDAE